MFLNLTFQLLIFLLAFTSTQAEGIYGIEDKNSDLTFKTVRQIWESHKHPFYLDKWLQYADAYEKHLPKPIFHPENSKKERKEIRLLEIGVQSGGSLIGWKRYYGDNSTIVGIDIDPRCARSTMPWENIFVEIGSQLDKYFLWSVCRKYGPFNVIIDDGGHSAKMIITSIRAMFPNETCISSLEGDSIYAIEDLHTSVMKRYFQNHKEFSHDLIGEAFRAMHSKYSERPEESHESSIFRQNITSVHLYDSLAFFGKGRQTPLVRRSTGSDSFINEEFTLNPKEAYASTRRKKT